MSSLSFSNYKKIQLVNKDIIFMIYSFLSPSLLIVVFPAMLPLFCYSSTILSEQLHILSMLALMIVRWKTIQDELKQFMEVTDGQILCAALSIFLNEPMLFIV